MVAQLKQLGQLDLLEKAMSLIPQVRMDAGLPPLVTPTSQIIVPSSIVRVGSTERTSDVQ